MAYEATWRKPVIHKDRILTDSNPNMKNEVFLPSSQDQNQVLIESQFRCIDFNEYPFQMKILCSMECNKIDYCSAFCIVESKCRITNFWISPQDGPQDSDHVTCYSQRRPGNLILGATATSSNANGYKHPSLLTKGIFNYLWSTTVARIAGGSNFYMLFEFPSEVRVKTVSIRTGGNPDYLPSAQTEIRLGSSMPGGPTDFSQLKLIGTFDNPSKLELRTFTVNPVKKVKFLAVLEKDGSPFDILFLEVFQ